MKRHIITAWAESAGGPGWANSPLWFLVRDGIGRLSIECLQPDEQTAEMQLLYSVSEVVHRSMTGAVKRAVEKP